MQSNVSILNITMHTIKHLFNHSQIFTKPRNLPQSISIYKHPMQVTEQLTSYPYKKKMSQKQSLLLQRSHQPCPENPILPCTPRIVLVKVVSLQATLYHWRVPQRILIGFQFGIFMNSNQFVHPSSKNINRNGPIEKLILLETSSPWKNQENHKQMEKLYAKETDNEHIPHLLHTNRHGFEQLGLQELA